MASFAEVISYAGYVLLAVLVLLAMITVHEFGHFIAGKIFGFGIDEFAIGFGPKLFSKKKKNGEVFSIRLLPIGGFCAFRGEDKDDEDPSAFNNKKPWQRIIVLVSGAFMNYLLALLLIILMFGIYGQSALMTGKLSGEGEEGYSFYERDVILTANGKNAYMLTDLMNAVNGKKQGEEVPFTVYRDGVKKDITVKMICDADFKSVEDVTTLYKALGVYYETDETGGIVNGGMYSTSVRLGFFATIGRSFDYSFKVAGTVFKVLGELLTGALGIKSLGGTVTTVAVAADAIKTGGFKYLLNVASFIGVNLAVFNLLPIPALDGSRAVFTAVEWVRGKPLNRRVEGIIHTVGFVLILLFAVIVDLQRCF